MACQVDCLWKTLRECDSKSKIGYNPDKSQALMIAERLIGATTGDNHIILLERKSGQWKLEDQYDVHYVV
jgi:hypothetical protein